MGNGERLCIRNQKTGKQKRTMNTKEIKCSICGKIFSKDIKRINQTEKLGKAHVCSRKCASKISNSKRSGIINTKASQNTRSDRNKRPEEYKARQLVRQAIKKGSIERPTYCEVCSTQCRPEAHHEDHSQPYLILWVCQECHKFHDKHKLKGFGTDYSEQIK